MKAAIRPDLHCNRNGDLAVASAAGSGDLTVALQTAEEEEKTHGGDRLFQGAMKRCGTA
jgi:hypothetical protein